MDFLNPSHRSVCWDPWCFNVNTKWRRRGQLEGVAFSRKVKTRWLMQERKDKVELWRALALCIRILHPTGAVDIPEAKRARTSSSPSSEKLSAQCVAPQPNPHAQEILSSSPPALGAGDVFKFLTEGRLGRWCRRSSVRLPFHLFISACC
jgi:hypothetical protein